MDALVAPERLGSRRQARELTRDLAGSLGGCKVSVEFIEGSLGTPSFMDELVSIVLVEREAELLELRGLSGRLQELAVESAAYFEVSDRLVFD